MQTSTPEEERIELSCRAGQEARLTLDENPTTGFLWLLEEKIPGLEVTSDFEAPSTKALGAGGRRTFKFRASKPGRFQVALNHRRSWEPLHNIIQRKKATLTITPR